MGLTGEENWRPYKQEILFAVQLRGLTGYIGRMIPRPNNYPGPIYPLAQTTTPLFRLTPCLEEWEARDRLVAGVIISNITDPASLGIDETKRASEIWTALVKRFEKCDEQRIHLADTNLRQEKFDPAELTMEDHKKQMQNLIKKVHDLGGTATDAQFRRIVILSMPSDWRQDIQSVPGTSSADVFAYLHMLWYEKEEEWKEEEHDTKRIKVLMAVNSTNNPTRTNGQMVLTCHNCNKPGHIARKCSAKGGGMEGQWPKQNQPNKQKNGMNASIASPNGTEISSPMATYVMSAQLEVNAKRSMSKSIQGSQPTTDPANRQNDPVLRETSQQEVIQRDVDSDVIRLTTVTEVDSIACHGNTSLYSPAVPSIQTFIDSGASEHCWVQRTNFITYTEVTGQGGSSAISGEAGKFQIAGTGTVQFVTRVGEQEKRIQLRGVKHTPSFSHNLISLSTLDRLGMRGEWGNDCHDASRQHSTGGIWQE